MHSLEKEKKMHTHKKILIYQTFDKYIYTISPVATHK